MPTYRINLGQNGCPGKKIKVRKMPKRLLCVLELENPPAKMPSLLNLHFVPSGTERPRIRRLY